MVNNKLLVGKGRFVNLKRKTSNKVYDNFFVYIPVEVARDSSFPFEAGDDLIVKVEKGKNRVILEKKPLPSRP